VNKNYLNQQLKPFFITALYNHHSETVARS